MFYLCLTFFTLKSYAMKIWSEITLAKAFQLGTQLQQEQDLTI
jgi:hypothetical protein